MAKTMSARIKEIIIRTKHKKSVYDFVALAEAQERGFLHISGHPDNLTIIITAAGKEFIDG
jgi:hypothetical protein